MEQAVRGGAGVWRGGRASWAEAARPGSRGKRTGGELGLAADQAGMGRRLEEAAVGRRVAAAGVRLAVALVAWAPIRCGMDCAKAAWPKPGGCCGDKAHP